METLNLTPKELAVRDIEKKRQQREKGRKEATSFNIERTIVTNRRLHKARRRGNRSF